MTIPYSDPGRWKSWRVPVVIGWDNLPWGFLALFQFKPLLKYPQGYQGCQKNWKDLRLFTLVPFCTNIQPKVKKLQNIFKINKNHQNMFFGDFSNFVQFQLKISAKTHQGVDPQVLPIFLTPLAPLGMVKQWRYMSFEYFTTVALPGGNFEFHQNDLPCQLYNFGP